MGFIAQLGEQAATPVLDTALGIALSKYNDKRQIKQQEKLTAIQAKANKEAAQHSKNLQMEMWHDTNYSAQMEEIKKAGLNPALIYGMSGNGGTTGSAIEGAVSGGTAAGHTGEVLGMMSQKLQLQMTEAQIKLIEAQADKTKAETVNVPKTGQQLDAQTNNIISQTELNRIELAWANDNKDQQNAQLHLLTEMLRAQTNMAIQDESVSVNTVKERTQKIKSDAANAILTGLAIQKGIQVDDAQIYKIAQELAQGWKRLSIEKFKAEIEANFKGLDKIKGNIIETLWNKLNGFMGIEVDRTPNKIE